jgi:glycosyltransferase involved in cell wall biosynthesis
MSWRSNDVLGQPSGTDVRTNGDAGDGVVDDVVRTDRVSSALERGQRPHHLARPSVSVVIPGLNEERNLPVVAAHMPDGIDEIVFVNGDSQDNTAEVARELWPGGVHVRQTRKGKGNALACGFAAASSDIIVMIDADGSTDPAEIPRFVDALTSGADFAKGSRFLRGGGSTDITRFRSLGNRHLNGLVNILFATHYTDLCYGYNAFWRHCLEAMYLPDVNATAPQWGDGFEIETLINVRLAVRGVKIVEVASHESNRIHGRSNLNPIADGLRILSTIEREFLHKYEYPWHSRPSGARAIASNAVTYLVNGQTASEVVPVKGGHQGHFFGHPGRPVRRRRSVTRTP